MIIAFCCVLFVVKISYLSVTVVGSYWFLLYMHLTNFLQVQGNDGEDIISTLRNGAAAENAVALMQVRGYNHRRRPRHRLTPGTVKFAAFHVLSLEGSKGLTILEVAEKIQVNSRCFIIVSPAGSLFDPRLPFLCSEIWIERPYNQQNSRSVYRRRVITGYKAL